MRDHEGLVPGEPRAVAMLEAAYRLDRPEQAWVEEIRQAFVPSVPGADLVQGYLFDATDVKNLHMRSIRGGTDEQNLWLRGTSAPGQGTSGPAERVFVGPPRSGIVREAIGETTHAELLRQAFANPWGLVDGWIVVGGSLLGRGIALGALSTRQVARPEPSLTATWSAVSAHLSAAYCLREALAAGMAPTEGVFAADGKLLHAEGDARSLDVREALRHAVRAIDRARTRHRRHSPEALAAWQAVVAGRWTLVDQTESDGKRVLLARVNELPVRAEARLSGREAQALGLAAQGLSNKQIGYRLGVGAPAVTNYLKRAAQKLGVANRVDLVRRAQGAFRQERES